MDSQTAILTYADRLHTATASRHQAFEQIFRTELFSLTSLMGPINDGPEWPSDASWLAFPYGGEGNDSSAGAGACVISDGLSDPWLDRDKSTTGLGIEVFVHSPEISFDSTNPMAVADKWIFPMTAEISHTLASYPRLSRKLLDGEPLCLRFNIEHIKDGRGLVGVLLHSPAEYPAIALPTGTVRLIAATLLTHSELTWLKGRGEEGRRELLTKLYQAGVASQSLLHRPPVV